MTLPLARIRNDLTTYAPWNPICEVIIADINAYHFLLGVRKVKRYVDPSIRVTYAPFPSVLFTHDRGSR